MSICAPVGTLKVAVTERKSRIPRIVPTTGRRLCERIVTWMLLIPAVPMIAALWVLVKVTSPGPAIYRQRRTGLFGREFYIYKLRTMHHNCEKQSGAVWARPNDSRVTWLGKILAKTHLDELPQLFNVLQGDMSLVGPRPERPEIIETLVPQIPNYLDRLQVRPGVTGLAQICADADLTIADVRRKLRYDLNYMEEMSAGLDLKIIFCTACKVIGLNKPWLRALLLSKIHRKTPSEIA